MDAGGVLRAGWRRRRAGRAPRRGLTVRAKNVRHSRLGRPVGGPRLPTLAGSSNEDHSMATVITSECINCGACEPECPNTAIYQGGVEWQAPDGAMHAAISNDIFYIVPEKCTECVGFYDQEACAKVCPVDCCVPGPERPEGEGLLLERARALHPDKTIPDDSPSRFKKEGAAAPATNGHDLAAVAPSAAPAPKPAAAPAAKPAGAPAKAAAPPAPKPVAGVRGPVEKPGA